MTDLDLEGVAGLEALAKQPRQARLTDDMRACLLELEAHHDPFGRLDVVRRDGAGFWRRLSSSRAYTDATVNALWGEGLLERAACKERRYRLTQAGRERAQEIRLLNLRVHKPTRGNSMKPPKDDSK